MKLAQGQWLKGPGWVKLYGLVSLGISAAGHGLILYLVFSSARFSGLPESVSSTVPEIKYLQVLLISEPRLDAQNLHHQSVRVAPAAQPVGESHHNKESSPKAPEMPDPESVRPTLEKRQHHERSPEGITPEPLQRKKSPEQTPPKKIPPEKASSEQIKDQKQSSESRKQGPQKLQPVTTKDRKHKPVVAAKAAPSTVPAAAASKQVQATLTISNSQDFAALVTEQSPNDDISSHTNLLIAPEARYAPSPEYPEEARWEARTGTITVAFRILEDGAVDDVQVLASSGHADLDITAQKTIKEWRFDVQKVPSLQARYHYRFRFELR